MHYTYTLLQERSGSATAARRDSISLPACRRLRIIFWVANGPRRHCGATPAYDAGLRGRRHAARTYDTAHCARTRCLSFRHSALRLRGRLTGPVLCTGYYTPDVGFYNDWTLKLGRHTPATARLRVWNIFLDSVTLAPCCADELA